MEKVIHAELESLAKRKVFGPVVQTSEDIKLVGYEWIFVQKINENNEIEKYKAQLEAQGFLQRREIDYKKSYSLVMDVVTLHYLITLIV